MSELALRREPNELAMSPQRTAADIKQMVRLVHEVMKSVMHDGEHFGKIPGCGDKPALLKPGAEKLCMTFRLAAMPEIQTTDLGGGHREYRVLTKLVHIPSSDVWGVGVGVCSTMESKYRYRGGSRKCPECGAQAIIKGKKEYGGGWLCFAKKGGCGAKWQDGADEIESQSGEKQDNPDIADTYNTVLKMAKKRSLVDATLTATAASDCFTQDIEELAPDPEVVPEPPPPQRATPAKPKPANGKAKKSPYDTFKHAAWDWTKLNAEDMQDACQKIAERCGHKSHRSLTDQEYAAMTRVCDDNAEQGVDFVQWCADTGATK